MRHCYSAGIATAPEARAELRLVRRHPVCAVDAPKVDDHTGYVVNETSKPLISRAFFSARHSHSIVNSRSAPIGETGGLAAPRTADTDMLTVARTRTSATPLFLFAAENAVRSRPRAPFGRDSAALTVCVSWLHGPMTVLATTVTVSRFLRPLPPRRPLQHPRGSTDDGPPANTLTATAVALVARGARIRNYAEGVGERRRPLIDGSEGHPPHCRRPSLRGGRQLCSGRSHSLLESVLTVSTIKPTFRSAISASPSGSYTRYADLRFDSAVSLLRRPLPCLVNWRYRPSPDYQRHSICAEDLTPKLGEVGASSKPSEPAHGTAASTSLVA